DGYMKLFAGSNGSNVIDNYAWYQDNSENIFHPVGTKLPNELGLYDMSGNVMEWCWDWFDWTGPYPSGFITDYTGATSGTERVQHGGSALNVVTYATVSYQSHNLPKNNNSNVGFRVVRR
ncbi:MAG: SUMF1/EgtB/PvdO family nonheme iron enzyme, partial [Deltaproteobacteria bacterium]|nr:SUMF1/EgtB/PvdO family nonheme iron enzyme [Deltaproteobacteria bacterium]